MTELSYIDGVVRNELPPLFYPSLFIGGSVLNFKKKISDIIILHDISEVDSFMTDYYGKDLDVPVIVEDLSNLDPRAQQVFLKFLEETKLKIVLLSIMDKILPTIISRMRFIFKSSMRISSALGNLDDYESLLNEGSKKSKFELLKEIPLVYYYTNLWGFYDQNKNFHKLLRIVNTKDE